MDQPSNRDAQERVKTFAQSLSGKTDVQLFECFRSLESAPDAGEASKEELHLQVLSAEAEISRRFPEKRLLAYEEWVRTQRELEKAREMVAKDQRFAGTANSLRESVAQIAAQATLSRE